MRIIKKLFIGFLICSIFNLFVTPSVFSALQYEETDDSGHSFKNWNTKKSDLPSADKKDDKSWFSRNKWWILLGVVAVGGGAAAAGGAGSSGDDESQTGTANVTW